MKIKFKTELSMLLAAIVLFTISTVCYSWATGAFITYPYRVYAVPFMGFGSVLMAAATVSYNKRSKNPA